MYVVLNYDLKVCSPCVGGPEEAPGSWFPISTALAIVANWGVNQWMEDLSVSVSLSLLLLLFKLYFILCVSVWM